MPDFGQDVTLTLRRGTLPAWKNPSCGSRWDGETVVVDGQSGVLVERCERLDEPEFGSEWWIVRFGSLYAPCEIHDHLGLA